MTQDNLQGFFNKSYPFDLGLRKRFTLALWTSLVIFLFILFFQPFEIKQTDLNNYILLIAGFAGIAILFQLIIHFSIPIGKLSSRPGTYNLNILLIFELIIWILNSVAFTFYLRYVGQVPLNIFLVFKVVIIASLPAIVNMVLYELKDLRLHLALSSTYSPDLDLSGKKEESNMVEFQSNSKAERLLIDIKSLIFIRSAENYVEIHYIDKDDVKKKLLRTTLSNIEVQLKKYPAIERCHRTCIVNLEQAEKLQRSATGIRLVLKDYNEDITVSRQYLLRIKDYFERQ